MPVLELLNWKLKLPINRGCPSLMRMILWWLKSRGLGANIFFAICTGGGHWTFWSIRIGCRLFLLPSFLFKMFGSLFLKVVDSMMNGWPPVWSIHGTRFPIGPVDDLGFSFKVSLKHFFWPFVLFPYCSWEQKMCLERRVFGYSDTVTSRSKPFFDDDRVSTDHFGFDKDSKAKC